MVGKKCAQSDRRPPSVHGRPFLQTQKPLPEQGAAEFQLPNARERCYKALMVDDNPYHLTIDELITYLQNVREALGNVPVIIESDMVQYWASGVGEVTGAQAPLPPLYASISAMLQVGS